MSDESDISDIFESVNEHIVAITDDSEDLRFLIKHHLQKIIPKFKPLEFKDGIGLMDYLQKSAKDPSAHPKPDVILLDLNMPNMNGAEVLLALSKSPEHRNIPVTVLTSNRQDQDSIMALGAKDFIYKPSTSLELKKVMQVLVEHWLLAIQNLDHTEQNEKRREARMPCELQDEDFHSDPPEKKVFPVQIINESPSGLGCFYSGKETLSVGQTLHARKEHSYSIRWVKAFSPRKTEFGLKRLSQ